MQGVLFVFGSWKLYAIHLYVFNKFPTLSSKTINFSFGTDKKVKPVTDSTTIPKANHTVTMSFIYNINSMAPLF